MSRPPLHALQGFLIAARLSNLSRAAEVLHLTVSALSHQISGLEERLGLRLFERSPRGITLTADGVRLQQRIAPHFAAIEEALKPYRAGRDSVLHLSLLSSMANAWLVPRLGRFVARHPQIEINLHSDTALVDFERDSAMDAALRYGPGRWPGVTAIHLFDDWIAPVASPALLDRHRSAGQVSLQQLPLLGDPGGRWGEWFSRFGGTPPARFAASFNDSESLQRAAVEGLGVALGRLSLARSLLERGRLVALCNDRLPSEFSHYLVYPPRSENHRGLALFRDWLLEEARDYAAADPGPQRATAAPSASPVARKRAARKVPAAKRKSAPKPGRK